MLLKACKVLGKSCLTTLYYTFAYPYFIHCNHVWDNTYQKVWINVSFSRKKLISIITGSPYRAHTELFNVNKILNACDLTVIIVGVFMYMCLFEPLIDVFDNYFHTNRQTRNADALYVLYGRVDVSISHDDVIKWKHFSRYWPFLRGMHRSPVNFLHKGQ